MKISQFTPINFKAICRGQYEDLKSISLANGMDTSKIDKFEKTIQEIFPYPNQILKFNILGNPASFHDVTIQLIEKDKVIQKVDGTVISKRIGSYTPEEAKEEKSNVFKKTVNLVKKLKNNYNTQLKNRQNEIEQDIRLKKLSKSSVPSAPLCKCVVSHDVDMIKDISINAGYPSKKAEEICAEIRKIFAKDKYDYKIFYLKFGEDDISNDRKYVIYHGIASVNDYYDIKTKTAISTGVTKDDRKFLLEKLYTLIKNFY